jgi:hypothetical protein
MNHHFHRTKNERAEIGSLDESFGLVSQLAANNRTGQEKARQNEPAGNAYFGLPSQVIALGGGLELTKRFPCRRHRFAIISNRKHASVLPPLSGVGWREAFDNGGPPSAIGAIHPSVRTVLSIAAVVLPMQPGEPHGRQRCTCHA